MNRKLFFKTLAAVAASVGLVRRPEAATPVPDKPPNLWRLKRTKSKGERIQLCLAYKKLKQQVMIRHGVEMEGIEWERYRR